MPFPGRFSLTLGGDLGTSGVYGGFKKLLLKSIMTFPSPNSRRPRFGRNLQNQSKDEHRINERIRVPEVRLIDEKGNQVGIVATQEALRMAKDRGLDLMEVSPDSRPPVCKICDYGKFKYEKKKKENLAKKKQTVIKIKELQLRPNTEKHDLETKSKHAREFLDEGDKVKFTVRFRGREIAHSEAAIKVMRELAEQLSDVSTLETEPKMDGRKMFMILAPVKKKASIAEKNAAAKQADKSE